MVDLPQPRVGFVGGIDPHTFDADLFLDVARRVPKVHFVLVGGCSLPAGWCDLPNVSLLGQRPYEAIPDYMAACDVLIMPWNQSRWIEACNPVKLKEYLATGRPVVSTEFAELGRYAGIVRIATGAEAFAEAIRTALADPGNASAGRNRVRNQGWSSKAAEVLGGLARLGIRGPGQTSEPAAEPAAPPPAVTTTARTSAPCHTAAPPVVATAPPRIAACILLAGGLRPSPLVAASGRSILDMWLTPAGTILDDWCDRIAEVAAEQQRVIPIRVVHDSIVPPPWPGQKGPIIIEQEPKALRGPAGVVRDLCREYPPDHYVLVAEAARHLAEPLVPMLDGTAPVTVAANADGTPAGVYLIRCDTIYIFFL